MLKTAVTIFALAIPATSFAYVPDNGMEFDHPKPPVIDFDLPTAQINEALQGTEVFDVAVDMDDVRVEYDCACNGGGAFFQGMGGAAGALGAGALTGGNPAAVIGGTGLGALAGERLHQGIMHENHAPVESGRPPGAQMQILD